MEDDGYLIFMGLAKRTAARATASHPAVLARHRHQFGDAVVQAMFAFFAAAPSGITKTGARLASGPAHHVGGLPRQAERTGGPNLGCLGAGAETPDHAGLAGS